jgi:hypothetical protein
LSPVAAILRRVLAIAAGYAAASFAASLCGHALALTQGGIGGIRGLSEIIGPIWLSLPLVAVIAGTFAGVPAGIAIAGAEIFSLRSALYFALAGAVAGAVALLMLGGVATTLSSIAAALNDLPPPPGGEVSLHMALPIVGAGVVSGLVYWAVAGRGSGRWRVSAPAPSGS